MPSLSFSGQLSGNALLGRSMHGKRLCDWQHRDSGRFHFPAHPNQCCAARRKRCWQGCPLPVQIEIPWYMAVMNFVPYPANRLGKLPDHAALQSHGRTSVRVDAAVLHISKPSWCLPTGPAKPAPDALNSIAHSSGSKRSAVNIGMKSLEPNIDGSPKFRR